MYKYPRLISAAIKKSKKSVLLLGPRQTGKSTLMRSLNPDLSINLADERTYLSHLRDVDLIRKVMKPLTRGIVFVDEIQRIPSLLNTIQAIIDEEPGRFKFLLTGSSARKLKRGQANLLPGRIHSFHLGSLSILEIKDGGQELDVNKALQFGTLPYCLTEDDKSEIQNTLRTYSMTYLREEIQAEALTRDLRGFARFFDVICSRNAQYLDVQKFSVEAEINRQTASRYLEILEDTMVAYFVRSFSKSGVKRFVQHPKIYFFDVGVLNGALDNFQASADRRGALFETFILNQLVSTSHALGRSPKITTYRTEKGAEVDFIVQFDTDLFALEIKSGKKVTSGDIRGLLNFRNFCGQSKVECLVLYLGNEILEIDGVRIYPWEKGLEKIFSMN